MVVAVVAMAVVAAPVLLWPASTTVEAASQVLTVTPSSELRDGDVVRLHAAGFTPGTSLAVEQCSAAPNAGEGDCNIAGGHFVSADTHGEVDTTLKVLLGPFGLDGIVCSRPPGCLVSVSQESLNPTELATATITFSPHPVARPGTSPQGPGASSSSPLLALVPPILVAALAAAGLRRRRDATALARIAAAGLLVGLVPPEMFALVAARGSTAGVNATELDALPGLGCQMMAVLVIGLSMLERASRPRWLLAALASVTCVAGLVLVALPALSVLGSGPADEGAGPVWYGGAAALVMAGCLAGLACLSASRRD